MHAQVGTFEQQLVGILTGAVLSVAVPILEVDLDPSGSGQFGQQHQAA